jgi:hypothetical protein
MKTLFLTAIMASFVGFAGDSSILEMEVTGRPSLDNQIVEAADDIVSGKKNASSKEIAHLMKLLAQMTTPPSPDLSKEEALEKIKFRMNTDIDGRIFAVASWIELGLKYPNQMRNHLDDLALIARYDFMSRIRRMALVAYAHLGRDEAKSEALLKEISKSDGELLFDGAYYPDSESSYASWKDSRGDDGVPIVQVDLHLAMINMETHMDGSLDFETVKGIGSMWIDSIIEQIEKAEEGKDWFYHRYLHDQAKELSQKIAGCFYRTNVTTAGCKLPGIEDRLMTLRFLSKREFDDIWVDVRTHLQKKELDFSDLAIDSAQHRIEKATPDLSSLYRTKLIDELLIQKTKTGDICRNINQFSNGANIGAVVTNRFLARRFLTVIAIEDVVKTLARDLGRVGNLMTIEYGPQVNEKCEIIPTPRSQN